MSTFVDITAGVPQGSVLDPLLFLIYTIDLPLACEGDRTLCYQFADDTALVSVGKNIAECDETLQRAVWLAGVWLKQWHLLVNTNKRVIMHFYNDNRPPNTLPTITLDGKTLTIVTQHRHWHHFSTQPTLDTSHRAYLKKDIQIIQSFISLEINNTSQCSFPNIYNSHSTHTPICLHCCDPCSLNSP